MARTLRTYTISCTVLFLGNLLSRVQWQQYQYRPNSAGRIVSTHPIQVYKLLIYAYLIVQY